MRKIYFFVAVLATLTVNAQTIVFPDAAFKAKLMGSSTVTQIAKDINGNNIKIDSNLDGEIQVSEALNVYQLRISNTTNTTDIIVMSGIEYFTNLTHLECAMHAIDHLDVTALTNLVTLKCGLNQMNSLNVTGLANLQVLDCSTNHLTGLLNVSTCVDLVEFNCSSNDITSLNVDGLTSLLYLDCRTNEIITLNASGLQSLEGLNSSYNNLTSIDVTGCIALKQFITGSCDLSSVNLSTLIALEHFNAEANNLTAINFENNPVLNYINIGGNFIAQVDVSNNPLLNNLQVWGNNLQKLFMKNGKNEQYLHLGTNPNLDYICADEDQIANIGNLLAEANIIGCTVNSYCTFVPGGVYYNIGLTTTFDGDVDGCDSEDYGYPSQRFSVSNGLHTSIFSTIQPGVYEIPVGNGSHTVTPLFEIPEYFSVTPSLRTFIFPDEVNTSQNFCMSANGIHPDLDIVIIPMEQARPGFDCRYRILCRNKGNMLLSGGVSFTFEDDKIDFLSSQPLTVNQMANVLSWSFSNLVPGDKFEIVADFSINSPTDSPPVHAGDQLNFLAAINLSTADESPADNSFGIKQLVVNSFDPNDKTCLEGNIVSPEIIGDYVHYVIRFENTGTANAQNIVVKDVIDMDQFDVATLIPLSGSHPFVTRISSTNKVEFIFENINLPFDDANNDGYIAFKIKTKPTLTIGDTFSNTASIYFDYNFPIVTNTATTMIQLLGNPDFEFSDAFVIYPNPTKDILNIQSKKGMEVNSVSIYNALGQLVMVETGAATLEVLSLPVGQYFLKVYTENGFAVTPFIKQ